jgi:hypothetical protein
MRRCRGLLDILVLGDFQEFLTVAGYRLLEGPIRVTNR